MYNTRKIFVVVIALIVGALHFVIRPDYSGPFKLFISGYLMDILLPFVVYFLIKLPGFIHQRWLIFLIVCGIGFAVETAQYFDIPLLGRTFDPLDYAMYILGTLLALITDLFYYSKLKNYDK